MRSWKFLEIILTEFSLTQEQQTANTSLLTSLDLKRFNEPLRVITGNLL
jgi:hypothetical protein